MGTTYEKLQQRVRELEKAESERKQAEEALGESGELYRILFEQARDVIYFTTPEGKLIDMNDAGLKLLGYPREEFKRIDVADHHADPAQREEEKRELYEKGFIKDKEIRLIKKDGSEIVCLDSATVLRNQDGSTKGYIGTLRDITDSKQTQEALRSSEERLRKSEKRFRDLFASISDVIYTQDLDGRFLSVNPAVCRLFGYDQKELVGRRVSDFMKPEFAQAFESEYLEKIKKDGYHEGTSVYFTREGKKIYLEYRSSMVYPEEGDPYITGTGRDVTAKILSEREVKKLHAQLTQAQKMEAIGTLAGGIAHNFNNVLMGIQGRASLMMMDKDPSTPDYEHLKGIKEYVKSATELTRDLLGFARGGKYQVKSVDLNALIRHESRIFGLTRKEISVIEKYERALWTVEVDQGQMRQVFLNLYVNAWQAMPGGGTLYVRTENVTLGKEYVKPFAIIPGRYVKISVTDTGTGMDDSVRKRIFDPFFSTKDKGQGSGLGLASVYGIIKNHGGFINVYSEKGIGTTFNIYLPASEKEAVEQGPIPDRREIKYGCGTVLLVDDEDMILEVGRMILEKLGYRVFVARSGQEALDVYSKHKEEIDLVILDMIMPGMGGGEAYDRLKAIDGDVKVLLSSGYSINGLAKEIMDSGCGGFIQKPFAMEELSRKIREVFDR
ncbi:MAG: PAS domain S-box protein [Desulfatiglandales bacterium]